MSSQAQISYEFLSWETGGFRLVFENLPVGIILTDSTGTQLMCNYEAERIFGKCAAEANPVEWLWAREIYRPDRKTPFLRAQLPLARAIAGEEVTNELMFVSKRGSADGLWVRASGKALKNAAGVLCGAVAVFFDITELRRAFEKITLLSLAVEQTADSIIITNTRGIIEYVNPAFETTTGYSRQEALGRTPAILKSGRHDARYYAEMWRKILAGGTFRDTLVNRKKTGELYYAEQTITPIRDNEGQMTHFVSVLKDVTALRKQQEQSVQLDLARQVQKRLYANTAGIPGLDIGAVALPADETGGDYFDFIPASTDSLTAAIGDVSGHGINAALGMALTRAYVRSAWARRLDLPTALASINNMVCADLEDSHYVTLLLVHLDMPRRLLTYASAGHVSALLFQPSGRVDTLDSTGIPLGLFREQMFTSRSLPIQTGQILVLLTDGVTDAAGGRGTARITDYIRSNPTSSAQQIADGICYTTRDLIGDDPQKDDITSLVIKIVS